MYYTLLRMWKNGALNAAQINKAVKKGWITKEQASEIMSHPQNV